MPIANRIKRLYGNLLRRRRIEDSLDAELRAYVEELTDRNIARGMPREAGAAPGTGGSGRQGAD